MLNIYKQIAYLEIHIGGKEEFMQSKHALAISIASMHTGAPKMSECVYCQTLSNRYILIFLAEN
jgi:hypothetical protein